MIEDVYEDYKEELQTKVVNDLDNKVILTLGKSIPNLEKLVLDYCLTNNLVYVKKKPCNCKKGV